ncbi:hypothetical protein Landi51_10372 [Colletotrichum acutatum]
MLSSLLPSLLLVLGASQAVAGEAVSGSHTKGSIFMFGDATACRNVFWNRDASGIFEPHGQAQKNRLCGKVITLTHKGVTRKAVVADQNTSSEQSIDMCLDTWQAFGGHDNDGTLRKGIEWSIAI